MNLFNNEFEKSIKGFNRLPDHILFNIFSFLNKNDLQSAQQVCQKWKYGVINPSLWKTFKIQNINTREDINRALKKVWMFGQLEKFDMRNVIDASVLLRQVYRYIPNLQCLIIRHCKQISSQTMTVLLGKCNQLKLLDLKGTSFTDFTFYDDICKLKKLEVLNLIDNQHLTTKIMMYISLNCRNLVEFYVSTIKSQDDDNYEFTDYDCSLVVFNLSKKLRGFSINAATLTDICFNRILLCDKLEHFGFFRAYNLNGKTFSIIWKYLKHLKTLKCTFGNQISSHDFETLFKNGKKEMSNLETIDFTNCWKMKNEAIQAISDSCPRLNKLIIKNCQNVTNIDCLKKCEKLETLNIAFCYKIELDNWLPIQDSIKTIFINKGNILEKLQESLYATKRDVKINVCLSPHEKTFEKYIKL